MVSPAAAEPRVPFGVDPGGVAVAIIGPGLDYTRPDIAGRLARDGEGEPIAWDFHDGDRAPYEPPAAPGAARPGTAAASIVLAEAPGARLVPLRPRPDATVLGQTALFLSRSPARIALVIQSSPSPDEWTLFAEVLRRTPQLLVIAAAGDDGADLDKAARYPSSLGLDHALVVTAADATGKPLASANTGAKTVDISVPANGITAVDLDGQPALQSGSMAAAARAAALAARLVAADPALAGARLKARILALAEPSPAPGATRSGWIKAPASR